jgi:hypothetical protein
MSAQVMLTQEDIDDLADGLRINVTLHEEDEDDIWLDGANFEVDQIELLKTGTAVEYEDLTLIPEED